MLQTPQVLTLYATTTSSSFNRLGSVLINFVWFVFSATYPTAATQVAHETVIDIVRWLSESHQIVAKLLSELKEFKTACHALYTPQIAVRLPPSLSLSHPLPVEVFINTIRLGSPFDCLGRAITLRRRIKGET